MTHAMQTRLKATRWNSPSFSIPAEPQMHARFQRQFLRCTASRVWSAFTIVGRDEIDGKFASPFIARAVDV
jgi:hypothetical protein